VCLLNKSFAGFYDFIGFACKCRQRLQKLKKQALPGFFLCTFSSITCLKETCFQQAGSSAVEGTSQTVLGSF
jgi:hypothetical protein